MHRKNAESKFVIQRSDVTFKDNEALVTIKHSKTDQQGKSVTLIFSHSISKEICPVSLLKQYLQKVLTVLYFAPITRYQVSSLLSRCMGFLGLQSTVIRPHSFHIGACSMAISQRIPESVVREMGRWPDHSTAFQRYIRLDKFLA